MTEPVVGLPPAMEIQLVSSMTLDDESRLAPSVLSEIKEVLDRLPVSYSLLIRMATGEQIIQLRSAAPNGNGQPSACGMTVTR